MRLELYLSDERLSEVMRLELYLSDERLCER